MDKGKVINFYSFKGGVGRSTILKKISEILHQDYQYNIVIMDMDFESPGHITLSNNEGGNFNILELFTQYIEDQNKFKKDIEEKIEENYGYFYIPALNINMPTLKDRLDEFKKDLYIKAYHFSFFRELINILSKKFDYIIIDNRIGLDPISLNNIINLSDITVWVSTLNYQNITAIRKLFMSFIGNKEISRFIFIVNIVPPIKRDKSSPFQNKVYRNSLCS